MAVLVWDDSGNRFYETGVSKVVVYPMDASGDYPAGYAWNGVISISETPSGAEPTALYADNLKYLELISTEEMAVTLEAYTFPDEFALLDGTAVSGTAAGTYVGQQPRKKFGLAFVTKVGNDVDGESHARKIHLIYGCLASPSEKAYQSINDSPEAITFSWEISTTPETVTGLNASSIVVIDSRDADPTSLTALELVLFGDVATPANLPHINAIITAMTP